LAVSAIRPWIAVPNTNVNHEMACVRIPAARAVRMASKVSTNGGEMENIDWGGYIPTPILQEYV
jgi:hypothetical protein